MARDTSIPGSSRAGRWLAVAAVTAAIYASLPFGPAVWRAFRILVGPVERWAALLVGATVAAALGWHLRDRMRRVSSVGWSLLAVVFVFYVAGFTLSSLTPAEKTHFLYYGLLAWVVYRALAVDVDPPALEIATVLVVTCLGLGDEAVQYVLPRRFFEWKDVGLNAISAGLATAWIAVVPRRER